MLLSSRGPTSVTYDPHTYQQKTLGCRWHPFAQGPSSETGQCTCGANTNQAEYYSSGPEQSGAHWEHEPYMQSFSCSHDFKRGTSAGIEGQGGGIGTNTQADWITQKFHESTNLLPDDTYPLRTSIESSGLLVLPTPVRAGDSLRYTSPSRSPYALRRVKRRGAARSDADQHTPKATRKQVTIEACDLQQAGNREHQRQYKKISDARDDSELSEEEYEEEDKKEDTDTEIKLQDSNILKKIPSKNRRRVRGPKSWEFLVRLLADPRTNPSLVRWEDESDYTFKLTNPSMVAQLWSSRSGLANSMTYNNFARGLRYHYSTGALEPVSEKQLVYRCGTPAIQYLKELKGKSTVVDL
ncbi:hypothetical protein Pcinc_027686 [Petrolisthes cinctipes]|uniref:ETS domain-containing protein n=1 Tax=Petrolisthes cinctipes TaxID=88211 RepID=A0AAE1F3H1_PETCI|nr:hypothetical protein Pcinc_027686 [Petrolisthes cinctipes]